MPVAACHLPGGSWVVLSGVISRVTILITHIRGLISLLITTHEPLSGDPIKGHKCKHSTWTSLEASF